MRTYTIYVTLAEGFEDAPGSAQDVADIITHATIFDATPMPPREKV